MQKSEEDQEDSQEEYIPAKKRMIDPKVQKRRGLIHSGVNAGPQLLYTQIEENQDQIEEHQTKNRLVPNMALQQQIQLNESEVNIDDIMANEDDIQQNDQDQGQIDRIKQLRASKRKMDGTDYVPFDQSTQEGRVAKDQISAANNRMDSLEGYQLQKQVIKSHQLSKQRGFGKMIDIDDDGTMHDIGSDEDKEEVEKLIQSRVKQGTGKDYDTILKRDIVAYSRLKGKSDQTESSKYESSQQYKKAQNMMESSNDDLFEKIDSKMNIIEKSVNENKTRMSEVSNLISESEQEINDSDTRFQGTGDQFLNAKEACGVIEDLKDILDECNVANRIDNMRKKRIGMEEDLKKQLDREMLLHMADIFKQNEEVVQPYSVNQKYTEEFGEMLTDQRMVIERKLRREQLKAQSNSSIWQRLIDIARQEKLDELKYMGIEAKNKLLSDVLDKYLNLKDSLYLALQSIHLNEGGGFKLQLSDLEDFIVPYFEMEIFSQGISSIITTSIEDTQNYRDLKQFIGSIITEDVQTKQWTSNLLIQVFHQLIISFVSSVWNVFDLIESKALVGYLNQYIGLIYTTDEQGYDINGRKQVQELVNAVRQRYKQYFEYLQLPTKNVQQNDISQGLRSLLQSIIQWEGVIPYSSLEDIIAIDFMHERLFKPLKKVKADLQGINELFSQYVDQEVIKFLQVCKQNQNEGSKLKYLKEQIQKYLKDTEQNDETQLDSFLDLI